MSSGCNHIQVTRDHWNMNISTQTNKKQTLIKCLDEDDGGE